MLAHWRLAMSRLFSPVGFGLVLLCFLLPFVGVSCNAQELGSVDVDYSGLDLASDGSPSVTVVGDFGGDAPTQAQVADAAPSPGTPGLAIAAAVLIALGLLASLIPAIRARPLVIVGLALLAGIQLVIAEVVAHGRLIDAVRARIGEVGPDLIGEPSVTVEDSTLSEMVGTRIGFWLALAGLLLIAGFTASLAYSGKRRPDQ
jgi:hypothetical protein